MTINAITPAGVYVPYTGATANVNLGAFSLTAGTIVGTNISITGAVITSSTGAISFDNEDLTTTGNSGFGTAASASYKVIIAGGAAQLNAGWAYCSYTGANQNSSGLYCQDYLLAARGHANPIASGGRFEALMYTYGNPSGIATARGGYFAAFDRAAQVYTRTGTGSYAMLGGYFTVLDALGDWTTNNPPVTAYGVYIDDAPTGYGSGLTYYAMYVAGGDVVTLGDIKLLSDTGEAFFGAGTDMKVWYDGTNGNIATDLVAPSDLHVDCGTAKTVVLDVPVYDDLRIVPGSFDRPGISDPAIVAYTPSGAGTATYLWEFNKNNIASFTVQLPHSYKEGENITAHVHWTAGARGVAEDGNTVGWKLDYTWANMDGTFGAMATADLSDTVAGGSHAHLMTPEVTLTGTSKSISSMLICNIKRTDTGTDDTWATNTSGNLPLLLEIDFHCPIDTIGSRQLLVK